MDKNCDLRAVANRILWGKTINAGQTCIAPDYVMCTKDIQVRSVVYWYNMQVTCYLKLNFTWTGTDYL